MSCHPIFSNGSNLQNFPELINKTAKRIPIVKSILSRRADHAHSSIDKTPDKEETRTKTVSTFE
jgi:hypothetical protein